MCSGTISRGDVAHSTILRCEVETLPDARELGLRGALFPGFKIGFDASTNGLLLATSVRGCQCADPVRQILTNGQRQPDELAAKLRRYELKGTEPRRASQRFKDWHPEYLSLHYAQRIAAVCGANNRTRPLQGEGNPLKRAIGRLCRKV